MDIDATVLTTTIVTSFLLPYLKLGGEKIAEKITEKLGAAAADQTVSITKKVWDRVKSTFNSEREQHIFSEFEEDPEATKALIEAKLKKKIEQDPSLAEDLHHLANAPSPDGASTGAQIMNAHIAGILDAREANFSNSSNVKLAGVMIEKDQSNIPIKGTRDETEDK